MASILINGQEYTLPEGEKLNAIQAAKRIGVEIPYYCWHPALSVVANCRMCEIEVGSKDPKTGEIKMVPKLVPGCQTPAKDGTVIVTDSQKVKDNQAMVLEYLLINHPIDCPECDQAGMCGLQDYSYEYGWANHRFVEEKIVNPRKDVSDKIQLNQDRCIMCTRCVRFAREISGTSELQVMRRGSSAEIEIFPDKPLDNPLAGNVVDLCPVGALLDKDFLHRQRFWFLSKHDTVCTRCSTGCNTYSEENRGEVWRFRARANPEVNDFWICDEGRFSYKASKDPSLLMSCYVRQGQTHNPVTVDSALAEAGSKLRNLAQTGGKLAAVISPFLTVEEAYLFASYIKELNPENVLALGPVPTKGEDVTFTPDPKKGRGGDTSFVVCRPYTIHAEKCPNRRGVEEVLKKYQGEVISFEALSARLAKREFKGLYVTSDAIDPAYSESEARALRAVVDVLIVQDTLPTPLAQAADIVLAGATFAEKAGCYVNFQGRLQYAEAALPPREGSLPDLDLLAILSNRYAGPVSSKKVLADLARDVPAFSGAVGGEVPRYGLLLDEPADADASRNGQTPATFEDAWLGARGRRGDRLGRDTPKGGVNA